MNQENFPENSQQEREQPFEVNTGDIVYVERNQRDEHGNILRDKEGNPVTTLADGWEVIDAQYVDKRTGAVKVLVQDTADNNLMKFYTVEQLEHIQKKAEENLMPRATDVAKSIVNELETTSYETPEAEPVINEKIVEDLGEEALDDMGVNEPESSSSKTSTPEDGEWSSIDKTTNALKRLQELDNPNHLLAIVDQAHQGVGQLQRAIQQYDTYPIDATRTILKQTIEALHEVHSTYRQYAEYAIQNVHSVLNQLKENEQGVGDGSLLTEVEKSTHELQVSLEPLAGSQLRGQVAHLEEILQNSYGRPINSDEVMSVVQRIQAELNNEKLARGITGFNANLAVLVEQVQQDITKLQEA